jgi:hypothetical protein
MFSNAGLQCASLDVSSLKLGGVQSEHRPFSFKEKEAVLF